MFKRGVAKYNACQQRKSKIHEIDTTPSHSPESLFHMATAYIEYLPGQNHAVTLPEHALRPPGVAYLAGEPLQAPIDIARNLPAENVLRNDIEQLCNATLTVDRAFYDIGQKLSQATKEQKKRAELYKICYDLETRWKQHHKTYKQLLWRSREVAGEARFVVD
ncbi:hypothetical protein PAXINDRAFT_100324, partial [Paxillus involutus ATCC 200175]